ncbi:ribonuclease 3 [Prevotella dentalis DSM 3688]|uniref:Ribonuclease 3 n=1 Tax=Prevotella dentalis (strain ATCC 49559 / DSM 3688 / JCM 13448 / NCTC 12043 / ES 2772) TaxID=908937 RepID=F9D575_PREDD|nr:ribonuclease 3 [Prevotella dentalis DSM 3688]
MYAPAGSERFWRILHEPLHFPEIIQYDIVHFRGTPEEFLQVLVIRAVMSRQVVLLFP